MAITAQLFDGTILEFPDDTDKSVIDRTVKRVTEEKQIKPDTGFTGAFSAGKERLKGDVALLAGKTGLMSLEDAERYKQEKDILAQRMFKPTEEGWSQARLLEFRETLGGSLPYMAAPLAAGVGAKVLGVGAGVGAGVDDPEFKLAMEVLNDGVLDGNAPFVGVCDNGDKSLDDKLKFNLLFSLLLLFVKNVFVFILTLVSYKLGNFPVYVLNFEIYSLA